MSAGDLNRIRRALQLLLGRRRPTAPAARAALTRARKAAAGWLGSPEIVGIGAGYRTTGGVAHSEPAIVVHVTAKKPADALPAGRIPPVLRLPGVAGVIPIDVVEGSAIIPHAFRCGEALASEQSPEWGTLGCLVVAPDLSSEALVLTCAHVLDAPVPGKVVGLGFPGGTDNPRTALGTLILREAPLASTVEDPWPNLYELALVRPSADIDETPSHGEAPVGFRKTPLAEREPVMLFGAKSGRLAGKVTQLDYNGRVESGGQSFGYSGLVLLDTPTQPGDSGAVVMDLQRRIVGLHMGSIGSGEAVMIPIAPILRRFNLRLPEKPSAAGSAAPMHEDRALAIDTLARTIWGEARGEPVEGQEAVANVVMNRVAKRRKSWGLTVEAACRAPRQFSCWNPGGVNYPKLLKVDASNPGFSLCLDIARRAVNGDLPDRTRGSTHYHTHGVAPDWSQGHTPAVVIANHRFFNDID